MRERVPDERELLLREDLAPLLLALTPERAPVAFRPLLLARVEPALLFFAAVERDLVAPELEREAVERLAVLRFAAGLRVPPLALRLPPDDARPSPTVMPPSAVHLPDITR